MATTQTNVFRSDWIKEWGVELTLAALAAASALMLFTDPGLFAAMFCAVLFVTVFFRFDLFVYAIIFLLPWYPFLDVNLPIRDVFVITRFLIFAGVFRLFVRQRRSLRQWFTGGGLKKSILIFVAIAVLSLIASTLRTNADAYKTLFRWFSYMAIFFGLSGWVERREQFLLILRLLLVSTILVALFGFYQIYEGSYTDLYFKINALQLQEDALEAWTGRIPSILFHFNSLAGYLNLVIPFGLASMVLLKREGLRALGLVCFVTASIALFFTQSRGGLLAYAAAMLLCLWCCARTRKTRLAIMSFLALAAYAIVPVLLPYADRLQDIDQATELSRLALWGAAASMFLSSPILGVGFGNYRSLYGAYLGGPGGVVDSHNLYLQFLSETGVVGFIAFFIVIGGFVRIGIKLLKNEDPLFRALGLGVTGALASFLVHGFADYLFTVSPQFGALFWVLMAMAFAAHEHGKRAAVLGAASS